MTTTKMRKKEIFEILNDIIIYSMYTPYAPYMEYLPTFAIDFW